MAALTLLVICYASANAQYLLHTLANNEGATAMCRDGSGNVFVLRDAGTFVESGNLVANGAVDEYNSNGTFIKTAIANTGEYRDALGDASIAVGIAVDGLDNIYVTTYNDFSAAPQVAGNIVKFTASSNYATSVALFSGVSDTNYGYFGAIACDSNGNLYAFAVKDANGGNTNVLIKIPNAETASGPISQSSAVLIDGSTFANTENNAFNDPNFVNHNGAYVPFTCLAIDGSNNIFLATAWGYYEPSSTVIGYDGGNLYEYTAASGYASANLIKSGFYGSELACDPNGDVIATVVTSPTTSVTSYQVLNYGAAAQGGAGYPKTLYTGLKSGNLYPTGMAAVSLTNVFVTNGNDGGTNDGDAYQLTGPPSVPASNVSGGTPGPTSATITWANGGGSSRAVFMEAGSSGTPTVSNGTTYSASTTFPTTPGSSWYCVYNGTGTSVTVTNLQPSTQYRAMVVEYNGTSTYTNYDLSSGTTPATGTNNPNNFTTATPAIGTSGSFSALSTTAGTASSSTSITVTGSNLVANVTATAPAGFDISLDNSTWSASGGNKSITPSSGSIAGQNVYVRLDAGDAINTYSGNVQLTSTSATTVNAAIPTSTVSAANTTISSLSAVTSTSTNAASVQYTATFAASVSGLSTSDFTLTTTGSVSGASVSTVTGSGTSWTVTVNTGSGDGTIQLVMNSSSGVSPSVSNLPFNGDTYNIDKTAPTIGIGSPSTSATNTGPVTFTVTYSDANFNSSTLGTGNITLNRTNTANGTLGVSGSGTTRTVTISSITGDGTLGITIGSGTATDQAGNSAPAAGPSTTFNVDNTAPTALSLAEQDGGTNTNQTQLDYTLTTSEAVTGVDAADFTVVTTGSLTYDAPTVTQVSPTQFNVSLSNVSGNGTLQLNLNSSGTGIADLVGNPIAGGINGDTFTVDQTAPTVSISAPSVSAINAGTGSVTYTVTYNDAHFNASTLSTGDITLNSTTTTNTASGTVGVSGTGNTRTVTISNITGYGTLGISIGAGTASDQAGNLAAAAGPSATFTVHTGNSALTNLTINHDATFSPAFSPSQLTYTSNVPYSTDEISLTPACDTTATVTVDGTLVSSGTKSLKAPLNVGSNTRTTIVTADDGTTTTYTVTVIRAASPNAFLKNLHIANQTMSPTFDYTNTSYTSTVSVASIRVIPTAADPGASITVNGTAVASGAASDPISLTVGNNTVSIVVTAADGVGTQTYTIAVTRAPSTNDNLANLRVNGYTLSPSFNAAITSYTSTVPNTTASVKITPTTSDPAATVTVNGTTVTSGTASGAIALNVGDNTITTVVTAQDLTTTKTYTITVTRLLSNDANLSNLKINNGSVPLSPAFNYATNSYTASVPNATASVRITPSAHNAGATITVNTVTVASGTASAPISLSVGDNTITTVVTAANGTTTNTYTITVHRAAVGPMATPTYASISVEKPLAQPALNGDDIVVHQGISPNGDGINDGLVIDGITAYPDNKLMIMNRNGAVVYEAKGYDNTSKIFDGHSNKNGALQLPGTYFYSLDFTVKGVTKHKTGFIILKY